MKRINAYSFSCFLFLLLIGCAAKCVAGNTDAEEKLFARGVSEYRNANYSAAIREWESLKGRGSTELFYNLGNAYYKTGDMAHAILNYERALKLDPSNEDAAFNLRLANLQTIDKIDPIPVFFLQRWWLNLITGISAQSWAIASLLLLFVSIIAFAIFLFSNAQHWTRIGFFSFLALGAFSFVLALIAQSSADYFKNNPFAVVMSDSAYAKSSPDEKGADLFILHEGTKVKLLDNLSGWQQIKLANGQVGWLRANSIEKI